MDAEALIDYLMLGFSALVSGWMLRLEAKGKENSDEADALKEGMAQMKLDLARNYHSKAELKDIVQEALKPVNETLSRLSRAMEDFNRGRNTRHNEHEDI